VIYRSGYYRADTQNGISFIGDHVDYLGGDIVIPTVFERRVKDLKDTECIFTYLHKEYDRDLLETLDDTYGLRRM